MTDTEIRDLEIQTARAMGWTEIHPDAYTPWGRSACGYLPADHPKSEGPFGNYRHPIPRFCTDPAATAEVKRFVVGRGWSFEVFASGRDDGYICARVWFRTDGPFTGSARRQDHGDDIARAEGFALCRAVLAALEATTETAQTAEQTGRAAAGEEAGR